MKDCCRKCKYYMNKKDLSGYCIMNKTKSYLKNKISIIRKLFWFKCPDCSGKLVVEMFDMEIDTLVYQCVDCRKEWV